MHKQPSENLSSDTEKALPDRNDISEQALFYNRMLDSFLENGELEAVLENFPVFVKFESDWERSIPNDDWFLEGVNKTALSHENIIERTIPFLIENSKLRELLEFLEATIDPSYWMEDVIEKLCESGDAENAKILTEKYSLKLPGESESKPETEKHERNLVPLFSRDDLKKRIETLAEEISAWGREANDRLLLICVLKGSYIFFADLTRSVSVPIDIEFAVLSSYGNARTSSGSVEMNFLEHVDVKSRRVLIVEDIIETGRTLDKLASHLRGLGSEELRICTLLDKPHLRAEGIELRPDYVGFTVPDDTFVVGYGLDDAQELRNLPCIYGIVDRESD